MRDSVIFYQSFERAILRFEDGLQLQAFKWLFSGAFHDLWPDESSGLPADLMSLFDVIKPQIEAGSRNYEAKKSKKKSSKLSSSLYSSSLVSDSSQNKEIISLPSSSSNSGSTADSAEGDGWMERKERFLNRIKNEPPSQRIIIDLCRVEGLPYGVGESFYSRFSQCGWRDNDGREIRDWLLLWQRWTAKEQRGEPDMNALSDDGQVLPHGTSLAEWRGFQAACERSMPQFRALTPEIYSKFKGLCLNNDEAVMLAFRQLSDEGFSDVARILDRLSQLREHEPLHSLIFQH